jgi:DNA polymerase delta subunit 1
MGTYACPPIASTTTAQGRHLIDQTKFFVERDFQQYGAKVVAGDTDSVFVQFSLPNTPEGFQRAFDLGETVADSVSAQFPADIILEFEKIYKPALLMCKKRYLGYCFEYRKDPGKIDAKGVALVRRDFSTFQRDTFSKVADKIMKEQDIEGSLQILVDQFRLLVSGHVPFEGVILTRQLAKEYKNENQMQKIVAEKIEARSPGYGPKPGDRVLFVVIVLDSGHDKASLYQKVEDSEFALKNNLPLDYWHYINGLFPSMETLYQVFDKKIQNRVKDIFSHFQRECECKRKKFQDISKFFPSQKKPNLAPESCLSHIREIQHKTKKKKKSAPTAPSSSSLLKFFPPQKKVRKEP